jgi:hypothetical protein
MRLYDRAVDLQLKLEAAQSADASVELLAKGARLVDSIERASAYFGGAAEFRAKAQIAERPNLDLKAITQAVAAFRAGLSRHGSAAFQHQPTANLIEIANAQRERATRWVAARWKEFFTPYDALLERVQNERLASSTSHAIVAQHRAATLRAVKSDNPVDNGDDLRTRLGGGDVEDWLTKIGALASQLHEALSELDAEQAALTSEVRDALQRAAEDGLPLSDLSDELLAALRTAGVDRHLMVRRQ